VLCLVKGQAVNNDSLALFFIVSGDEGSDFGVRSGVFFIFLLELHALVLAITGAPVMESFP